MRKIISHHQDSKAITRSLLAWIADPASHGSTQLVFSANCTLQEEASRALVNSHLAQTVQRLEFSEIYFSAAQLAELLSMPALEELMIWGGESYDWAGPKYVWDTLGNEHVEVLMSNADAQRLRVLELENQNFSEQLGYRLRGALPNLTTLEIERQSY